MLPYIEKGVWRVKNIEKDYLGFSGEPSLTTWVLKSEESFSSDVRWDTMMAERSERNLDVVNLEDRVMDLPADVYGQHRKLEKARKQTLP